MRLDLMEDGEFKPSEKFSIQIKNHKCYFNADGDKHIFGSKLYPIGKRAEIFTIANTTKGEYKEVAESLERGNWKPSTGRCYTNAEILCESFKAHGIDAKYFSGWVFPTGGHPIHHSWVVVNENVYDISINMKSHNLQLQQIEEGRDPYSKECIKEIKDLEANWKPITDTFVWGEALMIYVGAENSPNGARVQYNNCVGDVSKHPSYKKMGKTGKHIKSRYQQLLEEV
jgi:hypothetical protein